MAFRMRSLAVLQPTTIITSQLRSKRLLAMAAGAISPASTTTSPSSGTTTSITSSSMRALACSTSEGQQRSFTHSASPHVIDRDAKRHESRSTEAFGLGTPVRLPEFSLRDKVVLVTGGARGLGLTQAEALLEAGATGREQTSIC